MTLSPEKAPVLRGAELDALPLASLIVAGLPLGDPTTAPPLEAELVDAVDEGPTTEELVSEAYQSGFDEGVAAAEAAVKSTLQAVLEALEAATRDVAHARSTWESVGPDQTVGVALEIAEMILMREVTTSEDPGRDAIVRCLTEVESSESTVIRLNPNDLDRLGPFEDLLIDRSFELVADPSVAAGDAIADTTNGSVDARLRGALGRVREELLR